MMKLSFIVSKARIASGENYSSIEWYLHFYSIQGTFSKIAKSNASALSSFHPKVFGDASISTSYGTVGSFFRKYELHNEVFTANIPELLHSVTPNAKIIFILRDPVDRFYSAYQYSPFGRRHGTPGDFHKQTMNAIECFQSCLESHSLYYCGHHLELCKSHSHGHLDKLPIGMYSIFISDWLNAFPRKQLYFLTLTEWENNTETRLAEIFRFLELRPTGRITFDAKKPPINSRRYKDMLPKTRLMLQEFYQPFNTKLVQLLNDEKFSFSSLNGLT
ncbi:carbohydrate sulfotransferase 15-like [Anneissia japonica]|uniref:carbohydrate sulfotransferase 15-like n=1 Tax=Anneissia japonica TaxID=1529436 RepID=UPI001425569F|nr:carbohydrate sulfotransferase 15-like [Anneissia japonica]